MLRATETHRITGVFSPRDRQRGVRRDSPTKAWHTRSCLADIAGLSAGASVGGTSTRQPADSAPSSRVRSTLETRKTVLWGPSSTAAFVQSGMLADACTLYTRAQQQSFKPGSVFQAFVWCDIRRNIEYGRYSLIKDCVQDRDRLLYY